MAMTIVEGTRAITGGVDTHLEVHVAAALDPVGGLLGVKEFPTSAGRRTRTAGVAGRVRTGRTGRRGRHRFVWREPGTVPRRGRRRGRRGRSAEPSSPSSSREVRSGGCGRSRPRRARRTRHGCGQEPRRQRGSDPGVDGRQAQRPVGADQVRSTRSVTSASPRPKSCGPATKTSRRVKASPARSPRSRPRPGGDPVVYATKIAMRTLGRRVLALDEEMAALDELLTELVTATAPQLLALRGVGIDTAAILLVAAGDNAAAAAQRSRVGAPLRRRAHRSVLGQDRASPTQPRR